MKEVIPIFPLQIVAFPGEVISLHIFEPRYKELINDCKERQITFGITPTLEGKLMDVGTELKLTEIVRKYEDGRYDIRCMGIQSYKQEKFFRVLENKLYPGAIVEKIPLSFVGDSSLNQIIIDYLEKLYKHMGMEKALPSVDTYGLTFKIGHHVGLRREQECQLLSMETEEIRQHFMIDHLKRFIPTVIEKEEMRKKIQMNGHFRNLKSPDF